MARMLGDLRQSACNGGKKCTCNGYYRTKAFTRIAKRKERQDWKKDCMD